MKASMIVAALAAVAGTVVLAAPASLAAKPVRLTVVNQTPQAIHTNPQDGWEGDLQPGESKDFHTRISVGTGGANVKNVIITNYPAPQDGVSCTVTGSNPSLGAPSMYASCYNALGEPVVSGWSYTKVPEGSCGYVKDETLSGQHVYADFCRGSDTNDGYKHFIYYVYGN